MGPDIYATVSTEAEAAYLVNNFGIQRTHIFWSTDDSFLEEILQATGGEGVDLALNSLSGDLLHATWKSVAEFGKMIEVGTTDLVGAGKLELNSFLGGRSYTGVNLEALVAKRRSIVKGYVSKSISSNAVKQSTNMPFYLDCSNRLSSFLLREKSFPLALEPFMRPTTSRMQSSTCKKTLTRTRSSSSLGTPMESSTSTQVLSRLPMMPSQSM